MTIAIRKRVDRGVLFVHNNFPGQFGFIAQMLQREGVPCIAISSRDGEALSEIPLKRWQSERGSSDDIFPAAAKAETDMLRGFAVAERALSLKRTGFDPYLIIGHPGWGETLYLREVFPEAKQILYGEYYYRTTGGDGWFDPEFLTDTPQERFRVSSKNATLAMAYADADWIVTPTRFQANLIPAAFRSRLSIIHEGVDTHRVRRRHGTCFEIDDGPTLDGSSPIITFINRWFEPMRGYHIFMRALPRVLNTVPDAHVILIGSAAESGYGPSAPAGRTWKDVFLDEVRDRLDMTRVHFTGPLPHERMLDALSISTAHVYYTYPFVLSWSLMEAMAMGCLVVASDTAPVRDVVENGRNGILLDFFDHEALSDALIRALRTPDAFDALRSAAKKTIEDEYNRRLVSEAAWRKLLTRVLEGSADAYAKAIWHADR